MLAEASEVAPLLPRLAVIGWLAVGLGLTSCRTVPMSGAERELALEVRSADGGRVVRVGQTAVATIRFLGGGWGDYDSLRWELYFQGARIASGAVPAPGSRGMGRSATASRRLTHQDCQRSPREDALDSPMMMMTVYVRRVTNDSVVEKAGAPFSAECRR